MKTLRGIDLARQRTRAVLLDEDRKVIGRGITNSRSITRLPRAWRVRKHMWNGQFTLFRRALTDAHGLIELARSSACWRASLSPEQFLEQLDDLETCIGQIQGERFAKVEFGVKDLLGEVFRRLREEAPKFMLPAPSANRTSSAISPGRATIPMPKRSRARQTFPTICFSMLRQIDYRGGEPTAGGRAE